MTALAEALSAALLHFVWQGAVVGILLWVALLILRNRRAAVRYAAACAALAVLAILPAATAWILYESPGPAAAGTWLLAAPAGAVVPAAGGAAVSWLRRLQPWALPAWSLGVLLLSIRLVLSSLEVYRLRRRGRPAAGDVLDAVQAIAGRMGLARPLRVVISSLADGPTVIGWLRPLILLPSATVLGLTTQQLEAVLAHEIAHIRRYDYVVNLLQMAVETLLFYHPAVWWASARIRQERELCCDDLAVASCGDALCYARALTRLERLRIATPAMALGSTGGPLAYRIQRLVGAGAHGYGASKLPGLFAMIVGLACFGLNIHWAHGQEQAPQRTPEMRREDAATEEQLVREKRVLEEKLTQEQRALERLGEAKQYVFLRRTATDAVQVDTAGAAILHRTGVEYPHAAIENRIEGTVVVEATLDAKGGVDDARVLSGPVELRKAALQSVLQWHFVSELPGATRVVKIDFKLPPPGEKIAVAYTGTPEKAELEAREKRMQEVEKKIAAARENAATSNDAALIRELEVLRSYAAASGKAGERTLSAIRVEGLSDEQRNQLRERLPVHLGDPLTKEAIERTNSAVRQFDEHLELRIRPSGEGQSELVIVAPSGGRFEYRTAEPERVRK